MLKGAKNGRKIWKNELGRAWKVRKKHTIAKDV